ncbi:undecaprenyl-diphosphatase [Streptacidiphilus sp. MAP12-16]|uniref:phosphatase PAP2 family protein n=1 Tax=Streptacidiphilus sp. MAP12-16 TaxID=3156300 RepID=UPI0035133655
MATLLADGGGSIDWTLVSGVNGLARDLPSSVDSALGFLGEYGVPLASILVLLASWLWARRQSDAAGTVAGVLWAGLAAGMALMLNVPVRAMVQRDRPFVAHPGQLDLLMSHQANGSFASDHATFTMAVAVGVLLVHRKFGLIALALAGFEGFLRVFMGVHYPTDVIGGFALGTATTLLMAPIAMAVLVPLTHSMTRTAAASLIRAPRRTRATRATGPAVASATADHPDAPNDLAA